MSNKIKNITAREILDSRGNPTVECQVELDSGLKAKASVPSGASTGVHEALELRDGDAKRYGGLGVLKAVKNIEQKIASKLAGTDCTKQEEIDDAMIALDGTKNKSRLGANAILGVSLAFARATAKERNLELYEHLANLYFRDENARKYKIPEPAFNVLNGGKHANWATDIQEYLILPVGAKTIAGAVRMGAEIYQNLKKVLKDII